MQMTTEEICRSFRQAANKPAQVGVLADLNLTSKAEIKRILEKGGITVKKAKSKASKPTVWTPERKKAFEYYHSKGVSASEMA